jgi:hypothetical protein
MIQDTILRGIVTVFFVLSAAECLYEIATCHRIWTVVVRDVLHIIMSVAMVLMAWPWGAKLPTTGPMVFFLIAAVWFAAAGLIGTGHRLIDGYHALMMLAMAWMYAVMNGGLLPGQLHRCHDGHHTTSAHTGMPGMVMPGMDTSSSAASQPAWIDATNWVGGVGFAIAALCWLFRSITVWRANPAAWRHSVASAVRQALMAVGMAIMFAVMI